MPALDLTADLSLVLAAATEAGEVARSFWRKDPQVWEKDDGQGPVTEADLASDAALRAHLMAARPDYGWVSEESEGEITSGPTFVVDPIDGTRSFAAGEATWAVSVAVVSEGRPLVGAIVLPERGKTYAAARGHGATFNGAPLVASVRDSVVGAEVLANKATFRPEHWVNGPPDMVRHFRTSLAYRLALVGEGRYDAMLTLRDTWVWDVAAGALVAAEAGATVSDGRGNPVRLDSPTRQIPGIIAASSGVHRDLCGALTRSAA